MRVREQGSENHMISQPFINKENLGFSPPSHHSPPFRFTSLIGLKNAANLSPRSLFGLKHVSQPAQTRIPMDGPRRPSFNRRPEDDHVQSPVESSSDELAAASDYEDRERRRSSYVHPPQRPQPRTRNYSDSESTDELAMDADVYWSRNRRSPSQDESLPDDGEDDYRDADYVDEYRSEYRSEDEKDGRDRAIEGSDRSPTPVPPPPPPQPEKLNYKQKFLLKGHTRGVSAVQFSKDGSKIASAGI